MAGASRVRNSKILYLLMALLWVWLAIFVIYPLLNVMTTGRLAEFQRVLQRSYYRKVIMNTLGLGGTVALLSTTIAFIYAYTITKVDLPRRLRRLLHFIALIPTVSPPFIFGISLILLFGSRGLVTYNWLGLRNVNLYGFPGLVIVQTLAFFPFAYLSFRSLLMGLDPSLDEAGSVFGGGRLTVIRKVTFPLVLPVVISSFFMVFMLSATDIGNPVFIGGNFDVLSSQIYVSVIGRFDIRTGSILAILLLIPTLSLFALQQWIAKKWTYSTVTGKPSQVGHRIQDRPVVFLMGGFTLLMALFVVLFYVMILVGALVNVWGVDYSFTFRHFEQVLFGTWMLGLKTVKDTLFLAAIASLLGGLLSLATAYLITRGKIKGRLALDIFTTLPMAVPGIVTGLGYAIAFNKPPFLLAGTSLIIIAIFTIRTVPYGLRTAVAAMNQIDQSIEEASLVFGANEAQTFGRILLPLIRLSLLAGLIFSFTQNITTLSAVIFVISPRWNLITAAMLAEIETGKIGGASALGSILILIVLLLNVFNYFFIERKDIMRLED